MNPAVELIQAARDTLSGVNHWECNCDRCAARELLDQAIALLLRI